MRENGLEQRPHVLARLIQVERGHALQRRGVHHREVELLVGRPELVEQIEGLIHHPVRPRAGPVDLVHHDHGLQPERQGLAGHEPGLRHRPLDRVHQHQHPVDHRQRPLHLAAEVAMTGRVHDVDVHAPIVQRRVLGQDGDAALPFEVVAVHHPLLQMLVSGEHARLAQELVDQRGLAVVDVGDDGDVADRAGHGAADFSRGREFSTRRVRRGLVLPGRIKFSSQRRKAQRRKGELDHRCRHCAEASKPRFPSGVPLRLCVLAPLRPCAFASLRFAVDRFKS